MRGHGLCLAVARRCAGEPSASVLPCARLLAALSVPPCPQERAGIRGGHAGVPRTACPPPTDHQDSSGDRACA